MPTAETAAGNRGPQGRHLRRMGPGELVNKDAGADGQVGHRDGERTGGRRLGLGRGGLASGRGRRTAAAAADLHGNPGRGPEEGPQSAEADAALPCERVAERAAGDGAKRWPQDGRGRRQGRAGGWGEGRAGRLAPARRDRVEPQARQAGVYPQGERKAAWAWDSDGGGIVP